MVRKVDVPQGANVLGGWFMFTIENIELTGGLCEARSVLHEYSDSEQTVQNAFKTIRQKGLRVIITVEAFFGYALCSQDVSEAYFQSSSTLPCDVHVLPW